MHNMAEQKNIPAPESGRDAAEPAGVASVCRGDFSGVLIRVPRNRGGNMWRRRHRSYFDSCRLCRSFFRCGAYVPHDGKEKSPSR